VSIGAPLGFQMQAQRISAPSISVRDSSRAVFVLRASDILYSRNGKFSEAAGRGRKNRSTHAPSAMPASTSVAQCASRMILVAAMTLVMVRARGAARTEANAAAEASAPYAWHAQRKSIVDLAGTRDAAPPAMDHAAIRPFLRDHSFHCVRQDRGRGDRSLELA
jgi:hypothetical protein